MLDMSNVVRPLTTPVHDDLCSTGNVRLNKSQFEKTRTDVHFLSNISAKGLFCAFCANRIEKKSYILANLEA